MPYKWIKRKIQSLDPERDYEEIWRLTASYGITQFTMNFFYALLFPNIIVPAHDARPVWREDGGKVLHKATNRAMQTTHFGVVLAWYGPAHPRSLMEVDRINRLHEYWATKYPGDFSSTESYVYTICTFAVQKHRILLRLGLPGFSDNEKIAAHHFWRDIFRLFRAPGGRPLDGFPKNWNGMITYMEEVEGSRAPGSEQGRLIAQASHDQFAYRFFPPGLRWLGRSLVLSLSLPTTLEALRITPVNSILGWALRFLLSLYFLAVTTILPDPQTAYWERRENATQLERQYEEEMARKLDSKFADYFTNRHVQQSPVCPYMVEKID